MNDRYRYGELMILAQAIIYGLFPIMVNVSQGLLPPVFYAGASMLLASLIMLGFILLRGWGTKLWNPQAFPAIIGLTVTMALAYGLIFWGGSQSTGINISLLLQAEVVFTLLVSGLLFHERMSFPKVMAALSVFLGNVLILFDGQLSPSRANLVIVLATLLFPFGNHFAQQALKISPNAVVLFWRYLLAGTLLLSISWFLESYRFQNLLSSKTMVLIFFNGIVAFGITKLMWYEGLKRLPLSRAITLGMSFSLFGFLYAILFLGEEPSISQYLGMIGVVGGMFWTLRIRHPSPEHLPGGP